MTERKVLSCSPDVTITGRVLDATLWYPGVGGSGSIDAVDVSLVDVRAARGIRIEYDFDRDGYRILAERETGDCDPFAEALPEAELWQEEAFIHAWMEAPAKRCACGFVPLGEGATSVRVMGGSRDGWHCAEGCGAGSSKIDAPTGSAETAGDGSSPQQEARDPADRAPGDPD